MMIISNITFIAVMVLICWLNQRRYRKMTQQTIAFQKDTLNLMSKVIEAIEAYGDTQVEYHQHHCQASSLSLAAAQFDLFRMKQYLVDSEQYEAAKDVDRLLQAIHDTIIYNQNNERK